MENYCLTALCAVGAEKVLINELKKLGIAGHIEKGFGKVRFTAGLAGLWTALLSLRTADRVLLEAGCFPADNFDNLFERVRSVPWEDLIPRGAGVHIAKVRVKGDALRSEIGLQALVHKALAERLCAKWGLVRLPDRGSELRVHVEGGRVFVLLDLSGDPLFKRGYRQEGGLAPLRETTAAAIILLSMWRRKHPLLDPFCGSGTIAIEAALFAWNAAPGLGRNFALSVLPFSDPVVEKNTREELRAKVDFTHEFCIDGSDGDAHTVALARANSKRAYELAAGHTAQGDPRCLPRFTVARLQDLRPDPARSGYVLTNPPYGKRLGDRAGAEALYGELGRFCAEHLKNWQTCIISDHAGFESFFGKKASSCREITNGANPAYFFIFPPPCVPA